jgi:hypothetical protein
MATTPRLNVDPEMIERMEIDLATKSQAAYTAAGIEPSIFGIFSLDDLETKTEADLCQKLAVGVGYAGAEPTAIDTNVKSALNVGSSNAVKTVDFLFTIILAVPTGAECAERYSATKLLTVLRLGIMGSIVSGDITNRTWAFVKEAPNVQESTATMLYYSQVWRVAMPIVGPQ